MQLSSEEVIKIAKLARIALSDDEVEKFRTELSTILDYVEKLNEVDTEGVEETSQVTGLENRWRDDHVDYTFSREDMLESALETAEDHIKVKAVFAEDDGAETSNEEEV